MPQNKGQVASGLGLKKTYSQLFGRFNSHSKFRAKLYQQQTQKEHFKKSILSIVSLSLLPTKKTHTGSVYTGFPRGGIVLVSGLASSDRDKPPG